MSIKPQQFEITDPDARLISGWCSVEVVDKQSDLVPVSELVRSMYKFMDRGGFIIYGHSNKPVGKVLQWEIKKHPETGTLGLHFVAKIFDDYKIDDIVWEKIKRGEIKGFSIGATAESEEKKYLKDEKSGMPKEVGVLRGLDLMEISLVEEPANPLALVDEINFLAKGETKEQGRPRTDEERAKVHFGLTDEEWNSLSDEEKKKLIAQLPPVGTGRMLQQSVKVETKKKTLKEAKAHEDKVLDKRIKQLEDMTAAMKTEVKKAVEAVELIEFDELLKQDKVRERYGYNPWAICRAAQERYGWSDEKTERCVLHVKERLGMSKGRVLEKQEGAESIPPSMSIPEEDRVYLSEIKHPEKLPKGVRVYRGERGALFVSRNELRQAGIYAPEEQLKMKEWFKELGVEKVAALLAKRAELMLDVKKPEDRRPPKKWWDYCYRTVSEGMPEYTDEQVRAVCGSMWHHGWGIGSARGRREHA